MGSEHRRLNSGFVLKTASDQEEVVVLGLGDEDEEVEPYSVDVDMIFSPTSASPSGSVLSYAES